MDQFMLQYEEHLKAKNDVIESMKECIQLLLESRKEEMARLEGELLHVKNELHLVKVDLLYQKASLNHFKSKHPEIFIKDDESQTGAEE